MTKNEKKKVEAISTDEEMLFWTSYRYCIGRKTYVSDLAYYMAKKYYPLLSDGRLEFAANDIRKEIEDHFRFGMMFTLHYAGSVSYEDRKPYEDYIEFLMSEIVKEGGTEEEIKDNILKIKDVEIYHESYKKGESHKYHITYQAEGNSREFVSALDLADYLPWAKLAALFDKKHYKKVYVDDKGEKREYVCFEMWVDDYIPVEDKPGYLKWWPWHYKKVYISVDHFLKYGKTAGGIFPDSCITKVEDYDATKEECEED